MPVTINGNGSISGFSVGGLGSGVVNTCNLTEWCSCAEWFKTYPSNQVQLFKLSMDSNNVFNQIKWKFY